MRIAICPGSFDPITKGHLDIITRASKLFDKVIVLASVNYEKDYYFSVEDRMRFIRMVTCDLKNVEVDAFFGLLADYLSRAGACAIVKGLRAVTDFEYEFQMALANKYLYPQAETVFLTTSSENMYLSSSLVKQIGSLGGCIDGFVPEIILPEIGRALRERPAAGNVEEKEDKLRQEDLFSS